MANETAGWHGYSAQKENYAKRLRRIEGQVRGIAKMIDEDKYCIDVLTQISAVNSALQSVALGLLDEHLGHCVTQAVAEGGDRGRRQAGRGVGRDRPAGPLLVTERVFHVLWNHHCLLYPVGRTIRITRSALSAGGSVSGPL